MGLFPTICSIQDEKRFLLLTGDENSSNVLLPWAVAASNVCLLKEEKVLTARATIFATMTREGREEEKEEKEKEEKEEVAVAECVL